MYTVYTHKNIIKPAILWNVISKLNRKLKRKKGISLKKNLTDPKLLNARAFKTPLKDDPAVSIVNAFSLLKQRHATSIFDVSSLIMQQIRHLIFEVSCIYISTLHEHYPVKLAWTSWEKPSATSCCLCTFLSKPRAGCFLTTLDSQ